MNVSLRYQTHSRGRVTSSASQNLGDVEKPCNTYTGNLECGSTIMMNNVRHLWVSTDNPVDIIVDHHNTGDDPSYLHGVMIYTAELAGDNDVIIQCTNTGLESEFEPYRIWERSQYLDPDRTTYVDLQAFSQTFNLGLSVGDK